MLYYEIKRYLMKTKRKVVPLSQRQESYSILHKSTGTNAKNLLFNAFANGLHNQDEQLTHFLSSFLLSSQGWNRGESGCRPGVINFHED